MLYFYHALEKEYNISSQNGIWFHTCEWAPEGKPKGVVVLIHGLSDHAGRYRHVGAWFSSLGYAMILPELRGHGRSFGKKGHFPSYTTMMEDIALYIAVAKNRFPSLPFFLYGHSMGGNLVLNYLIREMPPLTGAIVTSPWLLLNFKTPFYKTLLAILINKIAPGLTLRDGINPSFLSHDPEVGKQYFSDPLVHSRISVRGFLEISAAGKYALDHADKISCPLLLMHGSDDPLTSFSATLAFSKKMITKHTFKPWDGLFHELHNEFEKEKILIYIGNWCDDLLIGEH